MRKDGIILLLIVFIPRNINLRRKKGRAEESHARREFVSGYLAEADFLKASLHRHMDTAPYIGRLQEVATHGQRATAHEADHANIFLAEDFQHLLNCQRRDKADLIIDENLNLRIRLGKYLVHLCRIGLVRSQREDFQRISCGQP